MPFPRALAKFNRQVTNRVATPVAGKLPGLGVIVHTGRTSGRVYRTPITLFSHDGVYRVALTYGRDVDWLKNILAAGEFEVEANGRTVTARDPVVRHDPQASWAPLGFRQAFGALGVEFYLEAHAA